MQAWVHEKGAKRPTLRSWPEPEPATDQVVIEVEAFDWNCPQFITPRFDQAELTALVGPELDRLETKIRELEAENAALKQTLGEQP